MYKRIAERVSAVKSMDVIIPGSDEQILSFALRAELDLLGPIVSVKIPLCERIRLKMRDLHVSGGDLSEQTGISRSKISRYLSGTGKLNSDEIEQVLNELNIL